MTPPKPYREFWIVVDPPGATWVSSKPLYSDDTEEEIHVVEFSALEAERAEHEKTKQEFKDFRVNASKVYDEHEAEIAALKAASVSLSDTIARLTKERDDYFSEGRKLSLENIKLEKELEELKMGKDYGHSNSKVDVQGSRLREIEIERDSLKAELEQAKQDLSIKIQRTVNAARSALLEMSSWLGIPEAKRLKQIDNYMENVNYCAEHDLRELDESQRNLALRAQLEKAKEAMNKVSQMAGTRGYQMRAIVDQALKDLEEK